MKGYDRNMAASQRLPETYNAAGSGVTSTSARPTTTGHHCPHYCPQSTCDCPFSRQPAPVEPPGPTPVGWDAEHWRYHCADGTHDSFWATVTSSPEWEAWEKEITRRSRNTGKRGGIVWDVDECREAGWISAEHFYDFVKFIRSAKGQRCRNERPKEKR